MITDTAPILGIVGGIGSGKSLVARALARHGGYLITGDELGHEALRQPDIKEKVVRRFGVEILDETGEIKRRVLGRQVFADAAKLRALEELVFPWIGRRIEEEIAKARQDPAVRMIVVDAAVMVEAGWDKNCDRVIFVDAPRALRLRRLQDQRGWSEQEVLDRESRQLPVDKKRQRADAVIDNSQTPARIAEQIEKMLTEWCIAC